MPYGPVTARCSEHGTTSKTFSAVRAGTRRKHQAAAPNSRLWRSKASPKILAKELKQEAANLPAALECS
ncbi:hypothetical protein [Paeniglutamicibacter gangotriensis]|uniref:hypothetical protein n=1 Tax=Paeniglutamicibacter gangotriensis TaxID=254787 RepID=UPI00126982D9|nr:hypothetical protein [Paeniglutamicibacter gangotriensis]